MPGRRRTQSRMIAFKILFAEVAVATPYGRVVATSTNPLDTR